MMGGIYGIMSWIILQGPFWGIVYFQENYQDKLVIVQPIL